MAYNDNQSPLKGTTMKNLDSIKKFCVDHQDQLKTTAAIAVGVTALTVIAGGTGYIMATNREWDKAVLTLHKNPEIVRDYMNFQKQFS